MVREKDLCEYLPLFPLRSPLLLILFPLVIEIWKHTISSDTVQLNVFSTGRAAVGYNSELFPVSFLLMNNDEH